MEFDYVNKMLLFLVGVLVFLLSGVCGFVDEMDMELDLWSNFEIQYMMMVLVNIIDILELVVLEGGVIVDDCEWQIQIVNEMLYWFIDQILCILLLEMVKFFSSVVKVVFVCNVYLVLCVVSLLIKVDL